MEKKNFQFYIKVRTTLSIRPTIIHDEVRTVISDEATSFSIVARWSQWFPEDRGEIEDEAQLRRPATQTTSRNIEQVGSSISDDPYITVN